jgi:hypothetical protein
MRRTLGLLMLCAGGAIVPLHSRADAPSVPRPTSRRVTPDPRDGSHDFDFEIGRWKVRNAVLHRTPTGAPAWIRYEGTSVARQVWGGSADLVELESDTPSGHREGLVLRLYNPAARQWSVSFASSADGTLMPPSIGEFRNGRGEFFGQDQVDGRTVLARSVLSNITATSYRLEQAISDDGGRRWRVTSISEHTRVD